MKYGVKLYGHLSGDKDRFARELAEVLDIDVENASVLMQNVPVVILPSASKAEADRMAQDLAAIRALYLIEPEGQEPEPEAPRKPLIDIPPEPPPDAGAKKNLRHGYMGMGLLLGGVLIVLIVGSVALFSLFKKIRAENQGLVPRPKVEETHSRSGADSATERPSKQELQERIDRLEARNVQLDSLIRLKDDEVRRESSSFSVDFKVVRQSRRELGELHNELRANRRKIKELKMALRRMVPPKAVRFQ